MRAHIYNITTGEIIRTVYCPDDQIESQFGAGESYIESDIGNDSTSYINNGVVADKPVQLSVIDKTSAAVDEAVTISLIPEHAFVSVESLQQEVTGGSCELKFDTPGEYQITVTCFPYLDKTFTVVIA